MKSTRRFPSIERLEDRIAPATFLVDSVFDNTNPGSLRVAIAEANANPGPDTITFRADVTGSINLALGRLEITDVVKITGPGADKLAIDGNNYFAIFDITNPALDQPVSISGLTLTHARSLDDGAALRSVAPVVLTKVKILDNHHNGNSNGRSGAGLWIHTTGDIVLKDCEISNNGGGITFFSGGADLATTDGKIVISGTKVMNNFGSRTGGINVALGDAQASLVVERSTFADNTGQADIGGGLRITSLGSAVTVKNSIFTSNDAGNFPGTTNGGAISQTGGTLLVQGSNFTGNKSARGGAIAFTAGEKATIQKSQFALNQAPSNAGLSGGAIYFSDVAQWQISSSSFIGNSGSGLGGAVAIELGEGKIVSSTFRGNSVGFFGGAVDFTSTKAQVTGSVFSANRASTGGGAVQQAGGELAISGSIFRSNSSGQFGGALRAFGGTIVVKASTFADNASDDGAAVYTTSDFTALGSIFRGNSATGDGGAIYAAGAIFKLSGGAVTDNRADGAGGGLFLDTGTPTVEKVLIGDNRSSGAGAGVCFNASATAYAGTVIGCRILDNAVTGGAAGGGLFVGVNATIMLSKSTLTGNFSGNGGGIYNAGAVIPTGNKITGNFAALNPESAGL